LFFVVGVSQQLFLKFSKNRKRQIGIQRHEAKVAKKPLPPIKRLPAQPKPGRFVHLTKGNHVQTITPVKYEDLF